MTYNDGIYPTARGSDGPSILHPTLTHSHLWFHRTAPGAAAESWGSLLFVDTIAWGGSGNLWPSHFPQWQDLRFSPPGLAGFTYSSDSLTQTAADVVPVDDSIGSGSGLVRARWYVYTGAPAGTKAIIFPTDRLLTLTFSAHREYFDAANKHVSEDAGSVSAQVTVKAGAYGNFVTLRLESVGEPARAFPDVTVYPGTGCTWAFSPESVS